MRAVVFIFGWTAWYCEKCGETFTSKAGMDKHADREDCKWELCPECRYVLEKCLCPKSLK
jgi:hypothetical protein